MQLWGSGSWRKVYTRGEAENCFALQSQETEVLWAARRLRRISWFPTAHAPHQLLGLRRACCPSAPGSLAREAKHTGLCGMLLALAQHWKRTNKPISITNDPIFSLSHALLGQMRAAQNTAGNMRRTRLEHLLPVDTKGASLLIPASFTRTPPQSPAHTYIPKDSWPCAPLLMSLSYPCCGLWTGTSLNPNTRTEIFSCQYLVYLHLPSGLWLHINSCWSFQFGHSNKISAYGVEQKPQPYLATKFFLLL